MSCLDGAAVSVGRGSAVDGVERGRGVSEPGGEVGGGDVSGGETMSDVALGGKDV